MSADQQKEVWEFNIKNNSRKCHHKDENVQINSFCCICSIGLCMECAISCINSKCKKTFCYEHEKYRVLCDHSIIPKFFDKPDIKCHDENQIIGFCNNEGCFKPLCGDCSYQCFYHKCGIRYCLSHGSNIMTGCKHKINYKPIPKISEENPYPFIKKMKTENEKEKRSCMDLICDFRGPVKDWFCSSRKCPNRSNLKIDRDSAFCQEKKCPMYKKEFHWCVLKKDYVFGNGKECYEKFIREGKKE